MVNMTDVLKRVNQHQEETKQKTMPNKKKNKNKKMAKSLTDVTYFARRSN